MELWLDFVQDWKMKIWLSSHHTHYSASASFFWAFCGNQDTKSRKPGRVHWIHSRLMSTALASFEVEILLFRGSSQATTGKLKKEFELRKLKKLKDRVQTIAISVSTRGKRSIFENVYWRCVWKANERRRVKIWRLVVDWLLGNTNGT